MGINFDALLKFEKHPKTMQEQNCNHSKPNYYQYKGYSIEIFLEADWGNNEIFYVASVELPNEGGVICGDPQESREEAEFSAEELIDSWN